MVTLFSSEAHWVFYGNEYSSERCEFPADSKFPKNSKSEVIEVFCIWRCKPMLFRVLFLSKSFMPVYFMYWDCIPGVRIFRIIIINVETAIEKKKHLQVQ